MNDKITCPSFEEYIGENTAQNTAHASNQQGSVGQPVDFAQPVDAAIIKVLDNKLINEVFSQYVSASVELTQGLELSESIKVSQTNNPELYSVIKDCSEKLNIDIPYTVISKALPGLNARTAGTDKFAYIEISSLLNVLLTLDEQKFVLGHECGHIALGHVVYHTAMATIGNLGNLVPIVGNVIAGTVRYPLNAWSRRSEISADRAGLICCGDVVTAKKALLKLEAGFTSIDNIDVDAYLKDSKKFRDNNSLGKFQELFLQHPIIPKRMEALDLFAKSEKYYAITGKEIPKGISLYNDTELEKLTNEIIKVIL